MSLLIGIVVLLLCVTGRPAVYITSFIIPQEVLVGDTVLLTCTVYTAPGESLYSAQWKKDGYQLYRHRPGSKDSTECVGNEFFNAYGVTLDCEKSTMEKIFLTDVGTFSSGQYECEILGDSPRFTNRKKNGNLTVYEGPLRQPVIVGANAMIDVLDVVKINCTSGNSDFTPQLSWMINNHPVPKSHTVIHSPSKIGLVLQAKKHDFINGRMNVACFATFGDHGQKSELQITNAGFLRAQSYFHSRGASHSLMGRWLLFVIVLLVVTKYKCFSV